MNVSTQPSWSSNATTEQHAGPQNLLVPPQVFGYGLTCQNRSPFEVVWVTGISMSKDNPPAVSALHLATRVHKYQNMTPVYRHHLILTLSTVLTAT